MDSRKKKIVVFTLLTANIEKLIFNGIMHELSHFFEVECFVISFESWYRRNIDLLGYKVFSNLIPNNQSTINVWQSKGVNSDFLSHKNCFTINLKDIIKNQTKIDLFISFGDNGYYEAETIRIFNNEKIPTVFVSHGTGCEDYSIFDFLISQIKKEIPWYRRNSYPILPIGLNGSKIICSINKKQFDFINKFSFYGIKNFLTGYPYIDLLYNFQKKNNTKLSENNNLLIISSDPKSFNHQFYLEILSLLPRLLFYFEKIDILLKPGEKKDDWISIKNNKLSIIENEGNIFNNYKILLNYKYIAGHSTQMLVEALLLKKLVFRIISIDKSNYKDHFSLKKLINIKEVNVENMDTFKLEDIETINDQEEKDIINENFAFFDGQNSKRVVHQLLKNKVLNVK